MVGPFLVYPLDFPEKRSLDAQKERSLRNDFMGDILLERKAFI